MNGIYIHLPFCLKKCAYCDFVSYTNSYPLAEKYIDSVILEMQEYKGEHADTVYFGGGTPTSLPVSLLIKLINAVYENFEIADNAEITVECNPKTANPEYFELLRKNGVNRLSIGVQSLDDRDLSYLGRIHSADDAVFCINSAKNAGFESFNVDLMFGIGSQTEESVLKSLNSLISLCPTHFSCYSLIVEENTPFGRLEREGKLRLTDEDTERRIYASIISALKKSGYKHYEISNFAKPGFESRHNIKYWKREPYIGLGAAAHSFYKNMRYSNPDDINEYLYSVENKTPRSKETVSNQDAVSEFIFLGLRMLDGISSIEFKKNFGKDINEMFSDEISELIFLGLLEKRENNLKLTARGIDVSNEVFLRFLP